MNTIYLYLAIAAAAFTAGGTAAWTAQSWRHDAQDKQRIEAQKELAKLDRKAAQAASEGFENDKTKTDIQYKTIVKEVQTVVERDVYRNVCIDADGLRLLNSAIRRAGDSGQLKNPVPSP